MTSPARLPSLTTRSSACRISSRSGGCALSQRKAAWALVTTACNRLVDFMGNRSGQLPHRGDAIGMREVHQGFAVSLLAFAQRLASARLRSVKSSTKATPSLPPSLQGRRADEDRHAAAVFPEILLLDRLGPSRSSSARATGCSLTVAPFGGRHVRPAHATRGKIFAVVSHHVVERRRWRRRTALQNRR